MSNNSEDHGWSALTDGLRKWFPEPAAPFNSRSRQADRRQPRSRISQSLITAGLSLLVRAASSGIAGHAVFRHFAIWLAPQPAEGAGINVSIAVCGSRRHFRKKWCAPMPDTSGQQLNSIVTF
jgi:hypothetical protein